MKRRSLLCGAVSAVPAAWAGTSRLESLRWLPEDRIDVGRASFALSQEFYPSVDIESFSRQLDALAAAVRRKVKSPNDPEERVWAMNTVFFQERGIRYDHDPQGRRKPLNYLLHGLLETGKGMCVSMPLLYVAVGQRLGYPIALVWFLITSSPATSILHLRTATSKPPAAESALPTTTTSSATG